MKRKFTNTFALIVLALLLLVPGIAWAAGGDHNQGLTAADTPDGAATNSVRIKIGGQPVDGPIRKGDVVHRGTVTQDEDGEEVCITESIEIRMRGDVKTVRVGQKDDSCDLEVQALVMSEPLPDEADAYFHASSGYRWRVESLAKVVGFNSIDDLTRTRAWFKFRTANFANSGTLFGGSDAGKNCWAHGFPPPWFYNTEDCDLDYNTSSSSRMYAEAIGEYSHLFVGDCPGVLPISMNLCKIRFSG